ncbi:YczE/YyaS/YitT family protein [Turicibacter sanguinis]|uniref:YczE/YyaS/YitT family protein n=1 Tax=Turicibacter sanguinis TaxID=154288 RepID=UPI0012BB9D21|nr:DUF6198 family protein [Turicibacter sanguinis]MDB8437936.1 DUF6198 family protein [Turicibacter sanguinis]MTO22910.1 hypothetical protein [Turicibacter sanguinis]MTO26118.1 hypothetical protein [Turicibacter sanguinis]MTO88950.1 hypothetical protein [Turicibacter sanguinis]MTP69059.1 hypothetical protein [Turicibacter sanguinis]
MKRNKRDYVLYLIGIMMLTLGVSLTVQSDLGAGSIDSINFALAHRLNINLSIVIFVMALLAIAISTCIRCERPKFTTLITAFFMAIGTEFWVFVVSPIVPETLMQKIVVFSIAVILVCTGLALYLKPKLPAHPNDDITVSISEVSNLKIGTAKLMMDAICMIIALLLQGPIGGGTIILTLFVGPGVNLAMYLLEKLPFINDLQPYHIQ